ncbi:MAG TPA: M48 family metallopeptidase [Tepidisphaeraceae bacterium]|nr:M48 family metallopeptidase [Tepidisphaeraceae bacterium]HEV8604469.1 M48 family metallopeptidase [Tepidisphaeraceae bacterium]
MSRVILLLVMAVWLVGAEERQHRPTPPRDSMTLLLGGYVAMVAAVAVWSRLLARRSVHSTFRRSFRRFNLGMLIIRWLIPAWMALDVARGGAWTQLVLATFGSKLQLPAMIVGIAPAMLTWVALWWAEYPAERAIREQNILDELMHGMPVHDPPRFARIFITSLRQQLLPIVIPILLITLLRDLLSLTRFGPSWGELMMVPAAILVYLISPFLLIWLFNARPLQPSPLRERLEAICKRCGLRYRNIMLWQTDYSMANAAVIGLLPGWRYVLLSDRLLETMTDREIEAVFAHELGHIVHNHMAWFVVFFAILVLASLGPGQMLDRWIGNRLEWLLQSDAVRVVWGGMFVAGTLILLGYLSRRLERQADVFAARMMEINWGWPTASSAESTSGGVPQSYVGQKGSAIFAAALNRVAYVNNIPINARGLFHPSIARRLRYLEELSIDPEKTNHFDEVMGHLYAVMILVLMTCGTLAAAVMTAI